MQQGKALRGDPALYRGERSSPCEQVHVGQPRCSAASCHGSFCWQALAAAVSAVKVFVGGVLLLWPGGGRSEKGEDTFLAVLGFS